MHRKEPKTAKRLWQRLKTPKRTSSPMQHFPSEGKSKPTLLKTVEQQTKSEWSQLEVITDFCLGRFLRNTLHLIARLRTNQNWPQRKNTYTNFDSVWPLKKGPPIGSGSHTHVPESEGDDFRFCRCNSGDHVNRPSENDSLIIILPHYWRRTKWS